MKAITALFFDVGGVLLTNGWDRHSRRKAAEQFGLDREEFEDRHELVVSDFETGGMTLEQYLDRTVFYRARGFDRSEFRSFILSQSQPFPDAIRVLEEVASTGKCFLATLNNESAGLNRYRIERFQLRKYFDAFFSSCYLGVRKPDEKIYRLALEITQRERDEVIFVDDRPLNVERAAEIGIPSVRYENPPQLRDALRARGVL